MLKLKGVQPREKYINMKPVVNTKKLSNYHDIV